MYCTRLSMHCYGVTKFYACYQHRKNVISGFHFEIQFIISNVVVWETHDITRRIAPKHSVNWFISDEHLPDFERQCKMFFWKFSKALSILIQIWLKVIWKCWSLQELPTTLQHYGIHQDVTLDDYSTKNDMLFGTESSCPKIHRCEIFYGTIVGPFKIND